MVSTLFSVFVILFLGVLSYRLWIIPRRALRADMLDLQFRMEKKADARARKATAASSDELPDSDV